MSPKPSCKGRKAFPITEPNAFNGSSAFIAWPGVVDVVSRSPTAIGECRASTLQQTLPTRAVCRFAIAVC